jgi:hypothetical protein
MCELLDVASAFFVAHGMTDDDDDDDDHSGQTLFSELMTLLPSSESATSLIKLHMQVPKAKKISMEENMMKIWNFLREKNSDLKVDTYLVLFGLFKFGLEHRSDLESFLRRQQESGKSMRAHSTKSEQVCK